MRIRAREGAASMRIRETIYIYIYIVLYTYIYIAQIVVLETLTASTSDVDDIYITSGLVDAAI